MSYILECIRRIEKHRRVGHQRFLIRIQGKMLYCAIYKQWRNLRSGYPREVIAGFRNVLVHDYLGIDLEVIWNIMQDEVAELKQAVQAMLVVLSNQQE